MSIISRVLVLVGVCTMSSLFFIPIWRINLSAPQYPEGLTMKIWLTKLSGDVGLISGLNHYIGMGKIHESMFPEFAYMHYILAAVLAIGIATILFKRIQLLFAWAAALCLVSLLALYDMYRWGYEYGHNLDPHAAINVPGMTYQPPLIGYKKLLNFEAWSVPDIGGWLLAFVLALTVTAIVIEWKSRKAPVNLKAPTS